MAFAGALPTELHSAKTWGESTLYMPRRPEGKSSTKLESAERPTTEVAGTPLRPKLFGKKQLCSFAPDRDQAQLHHNIDGTSNDADRIKQALTGPNGAGRRVSACLYRDTDKVWPQRANENVFDLGKRARPQATEQKILEEDDAHDANSWIGGYCLMRA
jgi:hypothetical protein